MDFVRLKRLITVLMIGSQLLTIFWLLALYLVGGFAFDDLTTSIALLSPLFAGFTTMIVKDAVAEAEPGSEPGATRALPWGYAFLTVVFCAGFTIYLLLIVTLKGFNIGFASFDQFKVLLGVSETLFGVYVGSLMPTLFTHGRAHAAKKPRAASRPGRRSTGSAAGPGALDAGGDGAGK